ncbi:MAG: glycosyltransferase family 39 protein [Verrucomicrobia bacterium]|nr:glycosyltransferase family 39 protein [Verrucomicrobiota bacterium]
MPGAADFIQKSVHAVEAGVIAPWLRRALLVAAVVGLAVYHVYYFRGLATSQAMDQAQIGREIASFHGWRTNVIRPRAVAQLRGHGKPVARYIQHDTFEAPLPPLVNSVGLFLVKSHWQMTPHDLIYIGDKVIAIESIAFFLLSLLVLFFLARRLFDERLAYLACAFVLLCHLLWQYGLSGLPQMLMLFIFNCTLYALVRAIEARNAERPLDAWLAAVGAGFGLLALAHALTLWMFGAALPFFVFYFRPRLRSLGIVLGVVALMYAPWLLRNFVLTGNPCGVAWYSVLNGIGGHSEAEVMRHMATDLGGAGPQAFRDKIISNFTGQIAGLFGNFGLSIVALAFFVSLLHPFRSREAATLRWMLLVMWVGALLGMCVYGVDTEQEVAANQLHVLFLPIMSCFGLAWLLVQWNRLAFSQPLARAGFLAGLYVLCALPMIFNLPLFASPDRPQIRWPPYLPPYIAVLNKWMQPNEIVASDMPWAIAWYANRRGLWLPETVQKFTELNDSRVLGGPVNGLYLTPISGSDNKLRDIIRGEYKDWAQLILRTADVEKLPLTWATLLGLENECIFLSDHDRSAATKQ